MTVTAEYAQAHLQELLAAAQDGHSVHITRDDGSAIRLVSEPRSSTRNRRGLIGSMKGQIQYTEDWDSPEVNQEIARSFNESELFPPTS